MCFFPTNHEPRVQFLFSAKGAEVGTNIATDCGHIRMHAWPHACVKEWLALFGAEDDVDNDFTQRLRHDANLGRNADGSESRFQR
jgi:hypothetical protein